jgi:membrane protein insertase Oxa1/YidC/SpoIIIJ
MKELREFNPKLHDKLEHNPELILDLKEIIMANEAAGDQMATAEAVSAAADPLQYKPTKNFSMPFIWAYFTPVFAVTAAGLVKLQGFTQIPWMSFIILSGISVRLCILPLMIRQMTLINKMS